MQIYHWFVLLYSVISGLALAAIPMSAAGWITPDPLSGIPAMLLGVPWSYLLAGACRIAIRLSERRPACYSDGPERQPDLANWPLPQPPLT